MRETGSSELKQAREIASICKCEMEPYSARQKLSGQSAPSSLHDWTSASPRCRSISSTSEILMPKTSARISMAVWSSSALGSTLGALSERFTNRL